MDKWQRRGVLLFAAAVLLCVLCTGQSGDYASGYYRLFGDGRGLVQTQPEDGEDGVLASTEAVALPAGRYIVRVLYDAGDEDCRLTLYSPKDQAYIQAEDMPLEPGTERTAQFPFTLTGIVGELSVQFRCAGGGASVTQIELMRDSGTGFLREVLLLAAVAALTVLALRLYVRRAGLDGGERAYFLLACGAALLACGPLFLPYLVSGHDAHVQFMRIEGLASSLAEGQLPVRIQAAFYSGYGQPISIFYPELFLYLPAALRLLGMSLTSAVQVLLGLINLMSAAAMFHAARRIFRSAGTACIASVLYVMAVYRLSDMYTRMATGEALAMAFLPLVVCGMWELFCGDGKRWRLLALGFTAVFQSHVLSACLTVVFCCCWAALHIRRLGEKQRRLSLYKAAAAALLLNLWTLVPMVQYCFLHITESLGWTRPSENAMYVFQLLTGAALPDGGMNEVGKQVTFMPLGLGAVLLAGCLLFILEISRRVRDRAEEDDGFRPALTFFLMGAFAAFMTTIYFPWELLESIPLLGSAVIYLQFTFRLLGYADALLALAAAWAIGRAAKGHGKAAAALVLVLSMLVAEPLISSYVSRGVFVYRGETVSTYMKEMREYKFPGTDTTPFRAGDEPRAVGEGTLSGYDKHGTTVTLQVSEEEEDYAVEVPLLWYPGYTARLDAGGELPTERGDNNVIRFTVPAGTGGTVTVRFTGFPLWRAAEAVSLATAAALAFWPAVRRRPGRKRAGT